MPSRIRRERTRGWRRGNAVIVDRTSSFGNPIEALEATYALPTAERITQ